MNRNLMTIIKKELYRVFSDKRLVFTTFILPALSIAIIYSIMGSLITSSFAEREEYVPSVFVQNAPEDFKDLLEQPEYKDSLKVSYFDGKKAFNRDSLLADIRAGEEDLFIVFEDDFSSRVEDYQTEDVIPSISTFYNSSEDHSADVRFGTIKRIFAEYEKMLLGKRVGNIEYANVFDIDRDNPQSDMMDEKKAAGKGFGTILPLIVSIFLFAGAMGIGMDTIAGEKERGTMATLLVTPVKRETIAFGKIISLGIIAIVSAASSFIGVVISLPYSSKMFARGTDSLSISALQFAPGEYVKLILIMVTLVAIYVGIICLLSIIAKNVKEAGTYITPVYMIITIFGFMNMFTDKSPELWNYLIPIYSNVISIKSLLINELTWGMTAMTCSVSIIFTSILIIIIKRMFNSEKIMFSN